METDETPRLPRPLHFVWAAVLAIGFLCFVTLTLPDFHSTPSVQTQEEGAPRQHVLMLLVDSTEHMDAHGEHVRSVIRQYCSACDVRQINVHGNMSPARLRLTLEETANIVQETNGATTVLINLSWGSYQYESSIHRAIRKLRGLGAIIIASAGNDNASKPFYPAALDEVLGVCSSSRYRKTKAAYSNFGPWVSLCAPGLHYVSRPLQHGGVAGGTSFASPMVTGILGQLLLDAPCATPQQGVQALLRTAEPFADGGEIATAGHLNRGAAAHYLDVLYSCAAQPNLGTRMLNQLRRVSSNALLFLGLLIYAVVSIFAFPFLFAYILHRFEQRAARRLDAMIQRAYAESSLYRVTRTERLKQRFRKAGRLRHRETVELIALLHACHLFDEPCEWCDGQQLLLADESLSETAAVSEHEPLSVCTRCGLKPEACTISLREF